MLDASIVAEVKKLRVNVESVFLGKPDVVKMVMVGLFSEGHVLIEDAPGVGKTLLARTLAKSINCSFRRIQFTPDLLPSDVIGVSVFNSVKDEFIFKRGPVFANVILADEINRTTPRTQSSLLEAMSDFQVSVDGISHPLPRPFMVIATQNPFEYEGTYPLPESQLDRFLLRVSVGYPDLEDEKLVLATQKISHPLEALTPTLDAETVRRIQQAVRRVHLDDSLSAYIVQLASETRRSDLLAIGMSPRGSLALYRSAQALALIESRDYVVPDDIKSLAIPVLSHRILAKGTLRDGNKQAVVEALEEILTAVPVPE